MSTRWYSFGRPVRDLQQQDFKALDNNSIRPIIGFRVITKTERPRYEITFERATGGRGQFIPWSWMARRIYRQFVYGLSRIGKMQVFTSSGAGTWGPPLRLGSNPEMVVLQFE
jgi:hypothetical protein